MIFRGSGPVLLRNRVFFVIFHRGPEPLSPPPPLDLYMCWPIYLVHVQWTKIWDFCRSLLCVCIALDDTAYYMNVQTPLSLSRWKNSHFSYVLVQGIHIQCSPFITHLIITWIEYSIVILWLSNFFHGILQTNYRKMIIKWSFFYNSFVKLYLYTTIRL